MAELTGKEAAFIEWCPFTILDENKAPKTAALVKAYRHAFDAGYDAGAKAQRESNAEDKFQDDIRKSLGY